jgi:hypothetical protein
MQKCSFLFPALAFFFAALPSPAQDQAAAARAAAGCGPVKTEFDVKTDKSKHPAPQPEEGKALVYVFEQVKTDDLGFAIGGVTTKVGLDGAWVGANQSQSYFFFPAAPGDHRLCTNWQSSLSGRSKLGSALSFSAEPGKVYYFRARVHALTNREDGREHDFAVKLEPLDPAEAQLLISTLALSSSHPKK